MRAKQKPPKADTENAAQFDAIAIFFFNAIAICTETGVNGAAVWSKRFLTLMAGPSLMLLLRFIS